MIETREDMDRFLAAQLEKLGTDHIDYYLLHSLDGTSFDKLVRLGVFEFLDQAKKDGRIVNPGFSFHGLAGDFNRIVDGYPWVFCQIQYNYLDENYQAGTAGLEYAAAKGLGVIAMEPLRGGNLANVVPPAVKAIWDEAEVQRTPAEWALRWVWNRPEVTVILSGMNDEAQIRENLAIANSAQANALSVKELGLVKRAAEKYQELMKVGCTGCGYCMPCPSDVMIPMCFEEFNKMYMFGAKEEAKFIYALRMSGMLGGASRAMRPNAPMRRLSEKCPQNIEVPDVLAQVVAEFEGPDLQQRVAMGRAMFNIRPK